MVKCAVDEGSQIFVYALFTALALAWGPIYLFFAGSSLLITALHFFGLLPTSISSYILSILAFGLPPAVLMAPVLGTAVGTMAVRRKYGAFAGGVAANAAANMMALIISAFALGMPALMMRIAAAVAAADLGLLLAASYLRCSRRSR
jgi:hypothetical protein